MNRDADNQAGAQWVAQCAHRLREQWPRADPTSLEEAAFELWLDESFRSMAPAEAAAKWLRRGIPTVTLAAGRATS